MTASTDSKQPWERVIPGQTGQVRMDGGDAWFQVTARTHPDHNGWLAVTSALRPLAPPELIDGKDVVWAPPSQEALLEFMRHEQDRTDRYTSDEANVWLAEVSSALRSLYVSTAQDATEFNGAIADYEEPLKQMGLVFPRCPVPYRAAGRVRAHITVEIPVEAEFASICPPGSAELMEEAFEALQAAADSVSAADVHRAAAAAFQRGELDWEGDVEGGTHDDSWVQSVER